MRLRIQKARQLPFLKRRQYWPYKLHIAYLALNIIDNVKQAFQKCFSRIINQSSISKELYFSIEILLHYKEFENWLMEKPPDWECQAMEYIHYSISLTTYATWYVFLQLSFNIANFDDCYYKIYMVQTNTMANEVYTDQLLLFKWARTFFC
jgi:hypothetical protein